MILLQSFIPPSTTGDPKGAMLTHGNFMSNVQAATGIVSITPDDIFLSFLPLSHVFERMGGHYLPLSGGCEYSVCRKACLRSSQDMQDVRPTIMMSVPRLYEGMHERILRSVKEGSGLKQKIFHWSVGVGSKVSQAIQEKRNPSSILSLKASIADKLVFQKLKAATGGRLRLLCFPVVRPCRKRLQSSSMQQAFLFLKDMV